MTLRNVHRFGLVVMTTAWFPVYFWVPWWVFMPVIAVILVGLLHQGMIDMREEW